MKPLRSRNFDITCFFHLCHFSLYTKWRAGVNRSEFLSQFFCSPRSFQSMQENMTTSQKNRDIRRIVPFWSFQPGKRNTCMNWMTSGDVMGLGLEMINFPPFKAYTHRVTFEYDDCGVTQVMIASTVASWNQTHTSFDTSSSLVIFEITKFNFFSSQPFLAPIFYPILASTPDPAPALTWKRDPPGTW